MFQVGVQGARGAWVLAMAVPCLQSVQTRPAAAGSLQRQRSKETRPVVFSNIYDGAKRGLGGLGKTTAVELGVRGIPVRSVVLGFLPWAAGSGRNVSADHGCVSAACSTARDGPWTPRAGLA